MQSTRRRDLAFNPVIRLSAMMRESPRSFLSSGSDDIMRGASAQAGEQLQLQDTDPHFGQCRLQPGQGRAARSLG